MYEYFKNTFQQLEMVMKFQHYTSLQYLIRVKKLIKQHRELE